MPLASQPENVEPVKQIRGYACTAMTKNNIIQKNRSMNGNDGENLLQSRIWMSTDTVTGTKAKKWLSCSHLEWNLELASDFQDCCVHQPKSAQNGISSQTSRHTNNFTWAHVHTNLGFMASACLQHWAASFNLPFRVYALARFDHASQKFGRS